MTTRKIFVLVLFFVNAITAASCFDCCRKPLDDKSLLASVKAGKRKKELDAIWVKGNSVHDIVFYDWRKDLFFASCPQEYWHEAYSLYDFILEKLKDNSGGVIIGFDEHGHPRRLLSLARVPSRVAAFLFQKGSPEEFVEQVKAIESIDKKPWLFNRKYKVVVVGTHEVRKAERACHNCDVI